MTVNATYALTIPFYFKNSEALHAKTKIQLCSVGLQINFEVHSMHGIRVFASCPTEMWPPQPGCDPMTLSLAAQHQSIDVHIDTICARTHFVLVCML